MDELNKRNEKEIEATNSLLLDMVRNQKSSMKNLVNTFIAAMICYTVLLIAMVISFFVYESHFEGYETETLRYEQETNSDNGDAIGIINNSGDWSYGKGKASSDDH